MLRPPWWLLLVLVALAAAVLVRVATGGPTLLTLVATMAVALALFIVLAWRSP